jgi:hypothetical protein
MYILKNCKKVKNEVTGTKKRRFWLIYLEKVHKSTFWGPVTSILTFLQFLKNAPDYINPSGHFVFYEFFCSSNF